jgi:hypothetical protein
VYVPWWVKKGPDVEIVGERRASGGKWGYGGILGMSFMLDVLDPRMARNLDVEWGINHIHIFGEYNRLVVDDFGRGGLNLSSGHWMFGVGFEL